jgi:hypothetical protein
MWRSWKIRKMLFKKLVEENVGKKHFGRPKRRFEGNIEIYFK